MEYVALAAALHDRAGMYTYVATFTIPGSEPEPFASRLIVQYCLLVVGENVVKYAGCEHMTEADVYKYMVNPDQERLTQYMFMFQGQALNG